MKTQKSEHNKPFLDDFDRDAREGWSESGLSETSTMRELDEAFAKMRPHSGKSSWITYTVLTFGVTIAIATWIFLKFCIFYEKVRFVLDLRQIFFPIC